MDKKQGFIWDKSYHDRFAGKTHWAVNLKFERFVSNEEFWTICDKTQFAFDHVLSTADLTVCTAQTTANFNQAITHNIWQTGGTHLKNGFAKKIILKNKRAKKGDPRNALFTVLDQWPVVVPSWESIQAKLNAPEVVHAEVAIDPPQVNQTAEQSPKVPQILSKMREMHWEKFEHFATDKVSKTMGAELKTTRPRGDGGKDSIGHIELELGVRIPIVIQSKQQKGNVDGDTVAAFCHRVQHGEIGFFITTSDFAPQARIEAENARMSGKIVHLISGLQFAQAIEPITEFTTVEQVVIT